MSDCEIGISLNLIQSLGVGFNSLMLISPVYVITALAIVYSGSNGPTLEEMFHFEFCNANGKFICLNLQNKCILDISSMHKTAQEFMLQTGVSKPVVEFGAVYVQPNFALTQSYYDTLQKYDIYLKEVDFNKPDALKLINRDIANATDQQIQRAVQHLDSKTR